MEPEPRTAVLPELRQELRLERGADGAGGAPVWLIIDPAQHRYVQIDEAAYQLLSCWQAGQPMTALIDNVFSDFHVKVGVEELAQFVRFLEANNLTVDAPGGDWHHYSSVAKRSEHGWLMWLIHNYLFIKLPLVRPESFLKQALPWVAVFFTRNFFFAAAATGLTGIYLVSRQWDAFRATFQHFFSFEGALTYSIALAFVKSAHELGHAFTAVRFGCRVPSMGICFLVMFPVLYTDVTDAWRLRSRRERLLIGAAGILVELAIACIATFLWTFLPEGTLKSLAFSIATVGWVLSLAINLNPLMRFDGYYLFADALGIDNLQSRAFAFGRWRMREILFDLKAPAPERMAPGTARTLTIYAWGIWIYRLTVFTGIALLVYHMAFKVLGIVLFLIEIIYFIARPITAEISHWWKDGAAIFATGRSRLTAVLFTGLAISAFVPWSTHINVPAVLEAAEIARIYPQRAGMVEELRVKAGDEVTAGDILARMSSPEIDHRIIVTARKLELVKMRLARRSSDGEDKSRSLVMERELSSAASELSGLKRERDNLTVRAPNSGIVIELNPGVHPGRAIERSELIALIKGGTKLVARGYIAERDLSRINSHASGQFIADLPGFKRIDVRLQHVANAGTANIEVPELASSHGGAIAVRSQGGQPGEPGHRRLIPVEANYLATMDVDAAASPPPFSARGVVRLEGEAQSLASRAWRQVAGVLVRESGF